VGLVREFEVFGRDFDFALLDGESHLVCGLVGEEAHAFEGVDKSLAVNGELVGIVFWDSGFVVGVFAVDESADYKEVVEREEDVGIVVVDGHIDVLFVGGENVLDLRDGLFGQDEAGCFVGVDIVAAVADKLVSVGSDEGDVLGGHFAEDARHLLAHFVVGGGESGFVDGVDEHGCGHGGADGFLHFGRGGKRLGILSCEVVFAFARADFDAVVVRVDSEVERHIVHRFEHVEKELGGNGDSVDTVDACVFELDMAYHGGFEVGGFDGQHIAIKVQVEAGDDGNGVVVRNDTANGVEVFKEELAIYNESHIVMFLFLIVE